MDSPNLTSPPYCEKHPLHLVGPFGCSMCAADGDEKRVEAIMAMLENRLLPIVVTPGETFDRLTILCVKQLKITNDPIKQARVFAERKEIEDYIWGWEEPHVRLPFHDVIDELLKTNLKLWNIEDAIRELDSCVFPLSSGFWSFLTSKKEKEYMRLARSVYVTNDERSRLKAEIDTACGYDSEVKQYTEYNNGRQRKQRS